LKNSESEVEAKKQTQTLIKHLLYIAFLLITALSFGQDDQEKKETKWDTERKKLKYKKEADYKGPEDWYGADPTSLKDRYGSGSSSGSGSTPSGYGSGGTRYSPQQIQRDRQKRYGGYERGGGEGTLKSDPKVKRPAPPNSPNSPDVNPPDIDYDAPDVNPPAIGTSFWKVLLYLLIIAAVVVIIYYVMKRYTPPVKPVVNIESEWNPEVISKTELELKLETAMYNEDYRECVRIYFTFILKELIRKGWIRWKKEKTNHHYVMELAGKTGVLSFMECVRIYDLVWYGDYNIDLEIFEMLKPTLENYYKSLDPADD
jgi:hypothetical protein